MVHRTVRGVTIAACLVAGLGLSGAAAADDPPITGAAAADAPAVAAAPACPAFGTKVSTGAAGAELPELSGLAPSLTAGRWWTHNDSGDSARIFLVDESLAVLAEVKLNVAFAFDIEDIAMGPDGRVWVADIGDNLHVRPGIVLWGVPQVSASTTVTPATLNLAYSDGLHNAESLMIDPLTGDGFIVAKDIPGGRAAVYLVPASALAAPPAGVLTISPVASIDVSDGGAIGPTAADISPSGRYIVIKTFTTTYLWPRTRGVSVADTLTARPAAPCRVADAGTNEAIAFSVDGRHLATVAEGVGAPLLTFTRTS